MPTKSNKSNGSVKPLYCDEKSIPAIFMAGAEEKSIKTCAHRELDERAFFITELIRPKTPASVGGGFQRAVKSSMDSANIQRGLNPPLNEVSFN